MFHAQIVIAADQLKARGALMQHVFVKKDKNQFVGSVVVKDKNGRIVFHKAVNLITHEPVRSGHDLIAQPSALQALDEHFTPKLIANDAMTEMLTLCSELNSYPAGTFASDTVHGQEVYYSNLDSLLVSNSGYINLR